MCYLTHTEETHETYHTHMKEQYYAHEEVMAHTLVAL